MSARFYRSVREAFPAERHPALFGPYRRIGGRFWPALTFIASLGLWAAIGVLLALGA
jgi:hypothetical protein